MSAFCIHEHVRDMNYYEPPERWCPYEDEVEDCDHCPYRYSKEDAEADDGDRDYDDLKSVFDF